MTDETYDTEHRQGYEDLLADMEQAERDAERSRENASLYAAEESIARDLKEAFPGVEFVTGSKDWGINEVQVFWVDGPSLDAVAEIVRRHWPDDCELSRINETPLG